MAKLYARTFFVALSIGTTYVATSSAPVSADVAHQQLIHPASDVTYQFPDGTTQRVSSTVAKALDKAFNGSQARAAYGSGFTWKAINPESLKTGDGAMWANYNALIVVKSGSIKVITNGQMKSFNSGDHGGFTGFYHPVKK
ncbi:hypothetical protein ABZX90_20525 [Streptomyces sp. NPDC002935]|uniref:hypothetical protein n=1 Tax=Streptomyces sp. NPDC002935 TaxID=3154545 RepID=UPI0033A14C8F